MSESILILGAGGHARALIDVVEAEGRYEIAGVVAPQKPFDGEVLGHQWLGNDDSLSALIASHRHVAIGVGQVPRPDIRIRLYRTVLSLGANLPVIVSPYAVVSQHVKIGQGTVVMHGAVVNAGAVLGENCIVNTTALVEHDVRIGNHSHIATGARVNGGCVIGEESFIGSGAVLLQEVRLPPRSVIPAAHVVRTADDVADETE